MIIQRVIIHIFTQLCLCVCVCIWNARRHARRACPKGTPEGRVPKGPRRGHCGRRPPGSAGGGRRRGGGHRPPKKMSQKKNFAKNSPEGATAAAGRQGVMEWGGREGGTPPTKKKFHQNFFFRQKFPRRGHCGRRPPGGAGGGGGRGESPSPKKKFTKKINFAKNFPEGRQGLQEGGGEGCHPPQPPKTSFHPKKLFRQKIATAVAGRQWVLRGGRKGGEVFPTFQKTGREAPHNNLVKYNLQSHFNDQYDAQDNSDFEITSQVLL